MLAPSGEGRKAHVLEDKQIPSVGVFYEVFLALAFGGNTRDLGSFGEETDEITDLHQILEELLFTERGDGVTSIKRRRRDLFSDGVWKLGTASGRGRLKEDLESFTYSPSSDPSNRCQNIILNGDLEEEVYMKQPKGFVMLGNEHKVCKLAKSLYGLKQAPKQWHQEFDEVVLSSGFLLNQYDKCVYSKFDGSVDKTKKFLSSKFSMKDMGEADVSTPMDPVKKLKPNTGKPVDQLEYSRAISCLMYAMTCTRPDIAYVVGRLSRFTSNPSRQHWHAITRVFKYLKDSSSTSGWVFLLGGGAISWAFKKQTCINGSTMES
ncbi:zinc finger, CCHC-type containing protein [Tanacetum coccineum]